MLFFFIFIPEANLLACKGKFAPPPKGVKPRHLWWNSAVGTDAGFILRFNTFYIYFYQFPYKFITKPG